MPVQYAPIYEAVAALSDPYVLPPDWSWLTVDADCRVLGDPVAAFAQLAQQFAAEELRASGVARQDGGEPVINPALTAQDRALILLRKANGAAFDIATAAGCISGAPPVLKVLHDREAKRGIRASDQRVLYATFSMVDAVLLRSLGVAVAPAALLESLSLPQLQRLLALVGGTGEGDIPKVHVALCTDEEEDRVRHRTSRTEEDPAAFSLVLLAGSLSAATAESSDALVSVARHLAGAERNLAFRWRGIREWYPSPQELDNLSYRRRLQSAESLRHYLLVPRGRHSPQAFERPGPPATPTLAATYFGHLKQQETRPPNPLSLREAAQRVTSTHRGLSL